MRGDSDVDTRAAKLLCAAQWRTLRRLLSVGAVAAATIALASAATAQPLPPGPPADGYSGVWFDDKGEGAVEIAPCAGQLCGRIVWLKAPLDKAGRPLTDGNNPDARQRTRPICGLPVLGELKRQRSGIWDEGWIYDPRQGKQFSVELTLRARDALQVMGYMGVKFLSETFMWRRAPADLKRCA